MNKIVKIMAGACLGVMITTGAFAEESPEIEKSTPEQAVKLVKKAIHHINKVGKEAAYADFNSPNNTEFHFADAYIFVIDVNKGTFLAHGTTPRLVGRNSTEIKDADGKFLIKEFMDVANKKGSGWVDYKWPNPLTKTYDSKSSYVEKSGDIIVGSGIYKQK